MTLIIRSALCHLRGVTEDLPTPPETMVGYWTVYGPEFLDFNILGVWGRGRGLLLVSHLPPGCDQVPDTSQGGAGQCADR